MVKGLSSADTRARRVCVCRRPQDDSVRRGFSARAAPVTPDVMSTAVELQHALARRGQHRVPIPDLIISAAALLAGLVVLHYDADFERIAAAGGAAHEWVVAPGSI